jgi:malonyl-CoA O-methyltransferase
MQASLDAIPIRDGWADITICGLTLGHLDDLRAPLAELCRVTRPGGRLVCSDFHPIGHSLGWRREFNADGRRYAVRHTWHTIDDWHAIAGALDLEVVRMLEPRLDPADIPDGARFDPAALEVPVALVFELRRA